MLTRSSTTEPKTLKTALNSSRQPGPADTGAVSVIGNDLKIIGQGLKIISRGILQVDGEIQGDVQGAEVIVGEQGKVTGMVAGQQVVIRGKVSGVISAKAVVLQASSRVEGDIHHMSIAVEQGAVFDGRSYRATNDSQLSSVVDGKAAGNPIVG